MAYRSHRIEPSCSNVLVGVLTSTRFLPIIIDALSGVCFHVGILLVWTIVSTLTALKYRDPAIAIALLVNATIILLAIFVRKIVLLNRYQKEAEEERKSHLPGM